jgi:hypothetical protein
VVERISELQTMIIAESSVRNQKFPTTPQSMSMQVGSSVFGLSTGQPLQSVRPQGDNNLVNTSNLDEPRSEERTLALLRLLRAELARLGYDQSEREEAGESG